MSAISGVNGKLVAADGISRIDLMRHSAETIREVAQMWVSPDHGYLTKAQVLRVIRSNAETLLRFVAENEGIPTVAEYQEAQKS